MKLNFNYCSTILFVVLNVILGILLIFLGNDIDYETFSLTICLFSLWYLKNNYFVDYCKKISLLVTIVNILLILLIFFCCFKLYIFGPSLNLDSTLINTLISSAHCGDELEPDYPIEVEPAMLDRTMPTAYIPAMSDRTTPIAYIPATPPAGTESIFTSGRILMLVGLTIPIIAYQYWGFDWEILKSIWYNKAILPPSNGNFIFLPTFPIIPGSSLGLTFPIVPGSSLGLTFPIVPFTPNPTFIDYSTFRHVSLGLLGFSGVTYPLIEINLARIDAPKSFFEKLSIFSQSIDFDLSRIFNSQSPLRFIITTEPNIVFIQRLIKNNKIYSILTIEGIAVFISYFIG